MVVLGVNRWVGVIGAISFGLATNNLVLFEAGHTSKLGAIAYMPLLAAGLLLAFRDKKYLAGALLWHRLSLTALGQSRTDDLLPDSNHAGLWSSTIGRFHSQR